MQQVKLWLLHDARNDPGDLGQTAEDLGPQGKSKAEDWRALLLEKLHQILDQIEMKCVNLLALVLHQLFLSLRIRPEGISTEPP